MEKLSVIDIIRTAWHQVKSTKNCFFVTFCSLAVTQLLLFGAQTELNKLYPNFRFSEAVIFFGMLFLTSPLSAGLSMLGLNRARQHTLTVRQGFAHFPKIFQLFAVNVFSLLFVFLGAFLMIFVCYGLLKGIQVMHLNPLHVRMAIILVLVAFLPLLVVISTLFSFSFMIYLEGRGTVLSAPFQSVKQVWPYFGKLVLLNLLLFGFCVLSLLLWGLALIWTLPLMYIATGIAYDKTISLPRVVVTNSSTTS